jgi:glycolate oxidase FAD binding subunit
MLPGPFEELVGRDGVRQAPDDRLDGIPIAFEVSPGTAEEVAACLRVAAEQRAAVVPSGGGSKLAWGNPPDAKEVVRLSLARLDRTFSIEPEEGIGIVGAGVRLDRLREATAALGRRSLLDTRHEGATVGGTVATEAFGASLGPENRLRGELLGIQVALPNGTLARAGGRVVKNVTGFDLVRLQCGAYGTLGVITEVVIRLRPSPQERRVLFRESSSVDEALNAAGELLSSSVRPCGAAVPIGQGVRLVWVVEGSGADVVARTSRFDGDPATISIWEEIERELARASSSGRARVRLLGRGSDVGALIGWLERNGGTTTLVLPSAGVVFGELPEKGGPARIEAGRSAGHTIFVEQASTDCKACIDVFGPEPDTMPLMRALKERFDRDRLLSPGRFLGRI